MMSNKCYAHLIKNEEGTDMTAHQIGILCGLLVGVLAGLAIVALAKKGKVLDCTFDERQELARGRAFKRAFFTLIIALAVYGASDLILGRWCDALAGVMLCICAAMVVFAATCIQHDAYLSLKETPRKVMTLFALLTVMNVAIGVSGLLKNGVVRDGILTYRATNLMAGVTTGVILVVYIVNFLLAGREDAE